MIRRHFQRYEAWWIFILTLLICLAANYWRNHDGWAKSNFELGGEYLRIAMSLLNGQGYASPFQADTGPTGWMPPGFTFLLLVTKFLTGGPPTTFTPEFLLAVVGLKCVFLAWGAGLAVATLRQLQVSRSTRLTFIPVWLVLGVWSNWEELTNRTHDSWWLAWVLMLCLHGIVSIPRSRFHIGLFAGMVLAALSSPVVWAAMIVCLGFRMLSFPRSRLWSQGLRPVAPAMAAGLLTMGVWIGFVHAGTGMWTPGKTNGGFELWQSLTKTPNGVLTTSTAYWHPVNNPVMKAEYKRLGERAFIEHYSETGLDYLKAHPGKYARQVVNRAKNALVWMETGSDSIWIELPKGTPLTDIMNELGRANLVAPVAGGSPLKRQLLFIKMSDAELSEFAPGLSPRAELFWQTSRELYKEQMVHLGVVDHHGLKPLARSGLVSLSWALAWLLSPMRMRRRVNLLLAGYLALLAPYILISHYERYQNMLIHLQVIVVTLTLGCVLTKLRETIHSRRRSRLMSERNASAGGRPA